MLQAVAVIKEYLVELVVMDRVLRFWPRDRVIPVPDPQRGLPRLINAVYEQPSAGDSKLETVDDSTEEIHE
jgi:hypothetical protein